MSPLFVSMSALGGVTTGEALARLWASGVRHVELAIGPRPDPTAAERVCAFAREGVRFRAHHAFVYGERSAPLGLATERDEANLAHRLDWLASIDAEAYTVHPGSFALGWSRERAYATFVDNARWLAARAAERGIAFGVEMMFPMPGASRMRNLLDSADEVDRFCRDVPEAGLVLDVAHLRLWGGADREALFDRYLARAVEVHVSDNDGRRDTHTPVHDRTWWWGKLASVPSGVPVVLESRLNRPDAPTVRAQLALLAGAMGRRGDDVARGLRACPAVAAADDDDALACALRFVRTIASEVARSPGRSCPGPTWPAGCRLRSLAHDRPGSRPAARARPPGRSRGGAIWPMRRGCCDAAAVRCDWRRGRTTGAWPVRPRGAGGASARSGSEGASMFGSVGRFVGGVAKKVGNAVEDVAEGVANAVGDAAEGGAEAVADAGKAGFDAAKYLASEGWQTAEKAASGVGRAVVHVGREGFELGGDLADGAFEVGSWATDFVEAGRRKVGAWGAGLVERVAGRRASDVFLSIYDQGTGWATGAAQNLVESAGQLRRGVGKLMKGDFKGGFADIGASVAKAAVQTPVDAAISMGAAAIGAVQSLAGVDPPSRGLTAAEIGELRKVFGDSVDYAQVRVKEGDGGFFGGGGLLTVGGRARSVMGTIYIPSGEVKEKAAERLGDDVAGRIAATNEARRAAGQPELSDAEESAEEERLRQDPAFLAEVEQRARNVLLVHEVTHVWQYQNGGNDYMSEAMLTQAVGEGYDLANAADKEWADLSPEQQGALLELAYEKGYFDRPETVKVRSKGVDLTKLLKRAAELVKKGQGAP